MDDKTFSVEELMLEQSFVTACLYPETEEAHRWNLYLQNYPDQTELVEEASRLVRLLYGGLSTSDIMTEAEKVQQQLKNSLKQDEFARTNPVQGQLYIDKKGILRSKVIRLMLKGTIAALILVSAYFLLNQSNKISGPKQDKLVSIKSGFGERKTIILPDGTSVILNSKSMISLKDDFNITDRQVVLEGNAYFDVSENKSRPFIVKTGTISTSVLGTRFYIHSPDKNEPFEIELLQGEVKVKSEGLTDDRSMYILAGEKTTWNPDSEGFIKSAFDPVSLRLWIEGVLKFDNTPVIDVMREIEQFYGVTIDINEDVITTKTITGEYNNVPIEDLLKVICFTIGCTYTIDNELIRIQ